MADANNPLNTPDNAEQNTAETSPNPVQSLFQNAQHAASVEQSLGQGDGTVSQEDLAAYAEEHGATATPEAAIQDAYDEGMQENTNDEDRPVVNTDPVVNPAVVGTSDGSAYNHDPVLCRDPSSLSFDELEAQDRAIKEQMAARRSTEREAAINQVKVLVGRFGLKPSEIRVEKAARAKAEGARGPVKPKYRNPENPDQTWTGRGIAPKWIAGYAKEDRDQFLIKE